MIASAVKHMLAAGMDAEAIVAAVEDMEAASTARSKHAEAQARYAAKKREKLIIADQHDHADHSKKESPQTPKEKTTKNPPSGVKKAEAEALIERLKTAYPKRIHPHPWSKALKLFETQLRDGADPNEIIRAAEIYAAKVRREGKEGTEFVKQITSFAGYWRDVIADQAPVVAREPGWPLGWPRDVCRKQFLSGQWPLGIGCPAPGEPGCKVPESIQAEWIHERDTRKVA